MTKQTVLIADDVTTIRLAVTALLSSILVNPEVDEASNGLEALQMTRNKKYDLVLMDLSMPVMGGVQATRAILAEKNCDNIIWMTLSPPEEFREIAEKLGVRCLLSKTEIGLTLPTALAFLTSEYTNAVYQ